MRRSPCAPPSASSAKWARPTTTRRCATPWSRSASTAPITQKGEKRSWRNASPCSRAARGSRQNEKEDLAMTRLTRVLAAALGFPFACGALAQGAYPNKPVTVVVGFEPGGGTDTTARILQKPMGAVSYTHLTLPTSDLV